MRYPDRADVLLASSVVIFACAVGLRHSYPPARQTVPPEPAETLAVGDSLPEFWKELSLVGRPSGLTLAFFYTTDCPWGRASVRRLNRLRDEVRRTAGATAVAVSLSDSASTASYASETGLAYPVARMTRGAARANWKVSEVPYTVLLDASGRVRGSWTGVMDSTRYEAVRAMIRQTSHLRGG